MPHNYSDNWDTLCHFAAVHKMMINTGYFSRVSIKIENAEKAKLTKDILQNQLDADSIYIFENDDFIWKWISKHNLASDMVGTYDGYRLIAPGFKKKRVKS